MGRGEDRELGKLPALLLRHRVELRDRAERLPLEDDPMDGLARPHHVYCTAAHPEASAAQLHVVPGVLHPDQLLEKRLPADLLADPERDHGRGVVLGGAKAVDAAHRRDHEHVPPREERLGRPMPEPVDLLVDRRVLLDVEIDLGNVCLGLVVVVVADEVLHGARREEGPEFAHELGGERLVRADDEGRSLEAGDRVRHREGLPAAGDAEQRHELLSPLDPADDLFDRGRLVALRNHVGSEVEPARKPGRRGRRGRWRPRGAHRRTGRTVRPPG